MTKTTRRDLFGSAAAMLAAAGATSATPAGKAETSKTVPFHLGIATYSLRNFSRSGAIKAAQALKVPYVNLKDIHLPLSATASEIETARKDLAKAKLQLLGVGNVGFTKRVGKAVPGQDGEKDQRPYSPVSDDDMRKRFAYAKALGAPVMVMAPMQESLPKIEALAKEFQIKVAIHNHGPEDKFFPGPADVLKAINGMDPLMGLCMDVGHSVRAGADIVESIRAAGPRLHDIHMKDLRDFQDKKSQCPVGEGQMPVVAIFKELIKIGYKGGVMLEYEIEEENPVPGMAKSFAYMRGVVDTLAS